MATSLIGDNRIPESLQQIQWAGLAEKLAVFNENSNGTMRLINAPGDLAANPRDFKEDIRFKTIASLDGRANVATAGTLTSLKLETLEGASILQARFLGPVEVADDFFKRSLATNAGIIANIAAQFSQAQFQAMRNNAIAILAAAAANVNSGAHVLDNAVGSTAGAKVTFTPAQAEDMIQKMGDARDKTIQWVIPSPVFSDLVKDGLANYVIDSVAGEIHGAGLTGQFMGRPVLIVDAPALITTLTSDYYTEYGVLLLGKDAVTVTITDNPPTELDRNIVANSPITTLRGQYYVDYSIMGGKWRLAALGNPTDATLTTAGNWSTDNEDHREFPTVLGIFNASSS